MKIIITESQYEMLFKNLPSSIKRRLTPDDFEYFDNNLNKNIHDKLLFSSDFDQFSKIFIWIMLKVMFLQKHNQMDIQMVFLTMRKSRKANIF